MLNYKKFKVQPYWVVGEIASEMLGLNPPLMVNYRKDLIEWSYNLLDSGRACYSYGGRWQNHNSLEKTVKRLKDNPTSKRLYVPIFDQNDVGDTPNSPCNLGFSLLARKGKLDLTLFTRSIDINRGFKYDPVLFSFIQQSLASVAGLDIGNFYYYCNSLHCYSSDIDTLVASLESIEQNNGNILPLNVDKDMQMGELFNDLRNVVEIDAIARNKLKSTCCFHSMSNKYQDVKQKISDMHYPLIRDFARILAVKNINHKTSVSERKVFLDALENEEYKIWVK